MHSVEIPPNVRPKQTKSALLQCAWMQFRKLGFNEFTSFTVFLVTFVIGFHKSQIKRDHQPKWVETPKIAPDCKSGKQSIPLMVEGIFMCTFSETSFIKNHSF